MSTVNISLTKDQLEFVNELTEKYGFANRSEFFRALLRRLSTDSASQKEVAAWPFFSPTSKSRAKILSEFKKTGKYSREFLADLAEGLENSNYFTK